MWLQNLLLLGTVVCSISAPTRPPRATTQLFPYEDVINEALSLLKQSNITADVMNEKIEVVSEVPDSQGTKCLQTRLELYMKGLRGSLTRLEGSLNLLANQYRQHCAHVLETSCATQVINFETFKNNLNEFLLTISFDC